MPFEVTTISVSVHSTDTSGIAYSSPGPVTAVKSGKTAVGHSPSASNALFAGTSGAGASVDATSVVVVSSPDSASEATVELSASDDEPQAIKVNTTAAKAIGREIFIPTV